jgi:hypothetical protein
MSKHSSEGFAPTGSPIVTSLQSSKNTRNVSRKGSKYVLTSFTHPPLSHMRSLLLQERFGKSYRRRNERKQRSDLSRCIMRSAMSIPILERVLTCDARVIEKLKEEGWAEELERHPSTYAALGDITGVRAAKTLTDRGRLSTGHLPHFLTAVKLGRDSNVQSSVGCVTRERSGSNLRRGT